MDFNVRLRQLRQKNKITQSDLADILGLKPTAISNYESKRNEPSFDKLITLCNYFDVSSDYLLGVSDTYSSISKDVLDKENIAFFNIYQRLNFDNTIKIRDYAEYLIYNQENKQN